MQIYSQISIIEKWLLAGLMSSVMAAAAPSALATDRVMQDNQKETISEFPRDGGYNGFMKERWSEVSFKSGQRSSGTLTDDGCAYLSGWGTDMSQMAGGSPPMEGLLNACHVGQLPAGCSWSGPETSVRIERDLSNCSYPHASYNGHMTSIAGSAPANSVVTRYDFEYGSMLSTYGPYRQYVRVYYRPYTCPLTPYHATDHAIKLPADVIADPIDDVGTGVLVPADKVKAQKLNRKLELEQR